MIKVQDGSRFLQFDGVKLAASTSERPGAPRWTEYELYRTDSGLYIISRRGCSRVYHSPECRIARRNRLTEIPRTQLPGDAKPCADCENQIAGFPLVCLEGTRHWGMVCETAEGVIDALHQVDDKDVRYLTILSKGLLEMAAKSDTLLNDAYWVQTVR